MSHDLIARRVLDRWLKLAETDEHEWLKKELRELAAEADCQLDPDIWDHGKGGNPDAVGLLQADSVAVLFVGEAKYTEPPGNDASLERIERYFAHLHELRQNDKVIGGLFVLAVMTEESARKWEPFLEKTARTANSTVVPNCGFSVGRFRGAWCVAACLK